MPEAFAHPAKFSRSLIQRIYQHVREEGWLHAGDWILDPFSGVSLGAYDALLTGYNVLHCELEPRFHELAKEDLVLWQQRYGHLPGYGQAILVQGDSTRLVEVLAGQVEMCVSSPPFLGARSGTTASHATQGGGPCAERLYTIGSDGDRLGQTPGNLATLPPGTIEACISSPPYASSDTKPTGIGQGKGTRATGASADRNKGDYDYGETPGNLGHLATGAIEAVVSSPPWECSLSASAGIDTERRRITAHLLNKTQEQVTPLYLRKCEQSS